MIFGRLFGKIMVIGGCLVGREGDLVFDLLEVAVEVVLSACIALAPLLTHRAGHPFFPQFLQVQLRSYPSGVVMSFEILITVLQTAYVILALDHVVAGLQPGTVVAVVLLENLGFLDCSPRDRSSDAIFFGLFLSGVVNLVFTQV